LNDGEIFPAIELDTVEFKNPQKWPFSLDKLEVLLREYLSPMVSTAKPSQFTVGIADNGRVVGFFPEGDAQDFASNTADTIAKFLRSFFPPLDMKSFTITTHQVRSPALPTALPMVRCYKAGQQIVPLMMEKCQSAISVLSIDTDELSTHSRADPTDFVMYPHNPTKVDQQIISDEIKKKTLFEETFSSSNTLKSVARFVLTISFTLSPTSLANAVPLLSWHNLRAPIWDGSSATEAQRMNPFDVWCMTRNGLNLVAEQLRYSDLVRRVQLQCEFHKLENVSLDWCKPAWDNDLETLVKRNNTQILIISCLCDLTAAETLFSHFGSRNMNALLISSELKDLQLMCNRLPTTIRIVDVVNRWPTVFGDRTWSRTRRTHSASTVTCLRGSLVGHQMPKLRFVVG
jgi:hypothetical protein